MASGPRRCRWYHVSPRPAAEPSTIMGDRGIPGGSRRCRRDRGGSGLRLGATPGPWGPEGRRSSLRGRVSDGVRAPTPPAWLTAISVLAALGQGQPDDEAGVAGLRFDGQVAAVPPDHDPVGDVQAEPGALADRLGGEERFEDALAQLFGDARAGVANLEPHPVAVHGGAYGERAVTVHGLDGVVDQIGPYLVQLAGVDGDLRQRRIEVLDDLDAFELAGQHHQGALEPEVDVDAFVRRTVHVRVLLGRGQQRRD